MPSGVNEKGRPKVNIVRVRKNKRRGRCNREQTIKKKHYGRKRDDGGRLEKKTLQKGGEEWG